MWSKILLHNTTLSPGTANNEVLTSLKTIFEDQWSHICLQDMKRILYDQSKHINLTLDTLIWFCNSPRYSSSLVTTNKDHIVLTPPLHLHRGARNNCYYRDNSASSTGPVQNKHVILEMNLCSTQVSCHCCKWMYVSQSGQGYCWHRGGLLAVSEC